MQEILNNVSTWLPLVAFVIPLIVGLITKSTLSSGAKAVIMIVVTGAASLINEVQNTTGVLSVDMLVTWLGAITVSVSSYYGVWKPITGGQQIAPNVGIGPSTDNGDVS